jgi:hypothetical protein
MTVTHPFLCREAKDEASSAFSDMSKGLSEAGKKVRTAGPT